MKNKVKLLKNNLYKINESKFCKLVISNWEKSFRIKPKKDEVMKITKVKLLRA